MSRSIMRYLRRTTVIGIVLVAVCRAAVPAHAADPARSASVASQAHADLSGIKTYMVQKTQTLRTGVARLQRASNTYYALASGVRFDYARLWRSQPARMWAAIRDARAAWTYINPLYEQMEGIVAGLPKLVTYDVILDSGAAANDPLAGTGTVVPFDLHLPNGRVLPKPGNLYGLTESLLWGSDPRYSVPRLWADYNGNGRRDFAEEIPDANVLKGASDAFVYYVNALLRGELAWHPTVADAFNCLIINVPTISDFFTIWRNSRFVLGDKTTRRDFVVRSRLWDIVDNVGSWLVLYRGLSPLVRAVDTERDGLTMGQLTALHTFVDGLAKREKSGKHFTPEEADLLGAEAQNRATAITGQITQVATELHVPITTA